MKKTTKYCRGILIVVLFIQCGLVPRGLAKNPCTPNYTPVTTVNCSQGTLTPTITLSPSGPYYCAGDSVTATVENNSPIAGTKTTTITYVGNPCPSDNPPQNQTTTESCCTPTVNCYHWSLGLGNGGKYLSSHSCGDSSVTFTASGCEENGQISVSEDAVSQNGVGCPPSAPRFGPVTENVTFVCTADFLPNDPTPVAIISGPEGTPINVYTNIADGGEVTLTAQACPSLTDEELPSNWSFTVDSPTGTGVKSDNLGGILYLNTPGVATFIAEAGTTGKCVKTNLNVVVKITIDKIAFNYDSAANTKDGLNIRDDYTTAISVPEYVKGGQNKPAAYVKNQPVKIKVRLTADPPMITSVNIKGVADDTNGSLGGIVEKTVMFSGGISQSGMAAGPSTTGINESEFIEFSINGNTPNKVFKSEDGWKWIVTKINGTPISDIQVDHTSGHKIYTVLATPITLPWNQTAGDVCNAWTKALDLMCDTTWAGGATDKKSAAGKIVKELYQLGLYPPTDSQRHQLDNAGHLKLGYLLGVNFGDQMNCEDVADIVTSLGNVIGCANGSVKLSRWFGLSFQSNQVWPLPGSGSTTANITYHEVTTGADGIFDACYGFKDPSSILPAPQQWAEGISLADYLNLLVPNGAPKPSVGTPTHPTVR